MRRHALTTLGNRFLGLLVLTQLLLLASATPTHAQREASFIADSRTLGGSLSAMLVEGRYVYATIGDRLAVFDLEAPGGMAEVAAVRPSGGEGSWLGSLARSGPYLVVSDSSRLWRFELPEPDRPVEVDGIAVSGFIAGIEEGMAYLIVREEFNIVDLSPNQPLRILSSQSLGELRGPYAVSKGRLLALDGVLSATALRVFDVSIPGQAKDIGLLQVPGAHGMLVDGETVYVSIGGNDCPVRLCLDTIDISEPSNPKRLGKGPSSLASSGHMLGGHWDQGLVAFYHIGSSTKLEWMDVSDPLRPRSVGVVDMPGVFGLNALVGLEDAGLVGSGAGLHRIDLEDPTNPTQTDVLPRLGWAKGACPFGDRFLAVAEQGGGWLLETDAGTELAVAAHLPLQSRLAAWGMSSAVTCGPDQAFAVSRVDESDSTGSSGSQVHIFDMREPDQPKVDTLRIPDSKSVSALTHAASGLITIEDFHHRDIPPLLRTWNSENPSAFAELGRLEIESSGYPAYVSAAADGATVAVAIDRSIHLIDISDPARPVRLAEIQHGEWIFDIDVEGDLAAFVDSSGNLVFADLREAELIGIQPLSQSAPAQGYTGLHSVMLAQSRAYVSGTDNQAIIPGSWYRSTAKLWAVDWREGQRPVVRTSDALGVGDHLSRSADGRVLGVSGSLGFARLGLDLEPPTPLPEAIERIWLPWVGR